MPHEQRTERRLRAAALALPFEHAKLSVSANYFNVGFGNRMEALMQKQGIPPVIDASPSRDREPDPT
jgi:hypothetical protein